MKYNDRHIASTVVEELEKSNSVFAFGLKLKSPFSTDASTIQRLRAFLFVIREVAEEYRRGFRFLMSEANQRPKEGVRLLLAKTDRVKNFRKVMSHHAGIESCPHNKITSFKRFLLVGLQRYMKNDWLQRFKVGFLKGELGDSARYPISGISERKGDDLTGSIPDHAVVAHSKNNKQYRINDFFSKGLNSYCFTGLVIGHITLSPLKDK